MNNKAQQKDWGGIVFFMIMAFLLAGILIYFLGNLAIWLGFGGLILSMFVLWIAGQGNSEEGIKLGIFILVLSMILVIGGIAITSFFENNEVGRTWLGGGQAILNTTAETYKTVKGGLG